MEEISSQLSMLSVEMTPPRRPLLPLPLPSPPNSQDTSTLPSLPMTPMTPGTQQARTAARRATNAQSLRHMVYASYAYTVPIWKRRLRFCRTCYRPGQHYHRRPIVQYYPISAKMARKRHIELRRWAYESAKYPLAIKKWL
jgi:hypothetical protein